MSYLSISGVPRVSSRVICLTEMYKRFRVELNCALVCHLFSSTSVFFLSLSSHFVSKCIYNWCHFFQDCAIRLSFSLQFPGFEVSVSVFLMYFLRSREELFEGSWPNAVSSSKFFCSWDFLTQI